MNKNQEKIVKCTYEKVFERDKTGDSDSATKKISRHYCLNDNSALF